MAENYRIVKSQLSIVGGAAGHNFVAVLDSNGKVVHELHGLATSKNEEIKPIGYLPSDKLKFYDEKRAGFYYRSDQKQTVLCTGSYEQVMEKFNLGYQVGQEINKLNLQYPFLGVGPTKGGWAENSNSVASTLLYGMGLKDPDLGWPLTPGEGDLLLPKEKIDEIINSYRNKKISSLENEREQPYQTASLTPAAEAIMINGRECFTKFCDYYNIDYPKDKLDNIAAAIAAYGRAEDMCDVSKIDVDGDSVLIGHYQPDLVTAEFSLQKALNTPVEESMRLVQAAENKLLQEERERQFAHEMERSRGISMS